LCVILIKIKKKMNLMKIINRVLIYIITFINRVLIFIVTFNILATFFYGTYGIYYGKEKSGINFTIGMILFPAFTLIISYFSTIFYHRKMRDIPDKVQVIITIVLILLLFVFIPSLITYSIQYSEKPN